MNYSISEFRKNIREALNKVEAGELVTITRHDKTFILITSRHWNDSQTQAAQTGVTRLVTDEVSSDIRPVFEESVGRSFVVQTNNNGPEYHLKPPKKNSSDSQANIQDHIGMIGPRIKTPNTPVRTDEEWTEAEGLEQSCCKKNTPCKHWVWNEATLAYQNILSNRERTVE